MRLNEEIVRIKNLMGVKEIKTPIILESDEDDILSKTYEHSYDFNSDVEELQKLLVKKGYYIGKYGKGEDGIDGKYGPMTQAAHIAAKQSMSPENFNENKEKLAQKFVGDVNDKTLENEFNFHSIPDGKNNYRSAQIPVEMGGKDYLGSVLDKYGIKTVIRFNGDGNDGRHRSSHPSTSIDEEKKLVESKGLTFHKLSSTRDQDKVNSLLSNGNVLIHCAHGADRTGGNVGGYLHSLGKSTNEIWDYTTQYNGWEKMIKNNPDKFVSGGYLKQAQKFGVKDINHAIQLSK